MNKVQEQVVAKVVGEVYTDSLKPTAITVGEKLNKVVKMVLSPIDFIYWGYEETVSWIQETVSNRLKGVPVEDIIEPDPIVSVPIIQNIRYSYKHKHLKEMYANLLAKSMNRKTADDVLPSFVEILKQLSPIDAEVLDLFSKAIQGRPYMNVGGYRNVKRESGYEITIYYLNVLLPNKYEYSKTTIALINLNRLGLIDLLNGTHFQNEEYYSPIKRMNEYQANFIIKAKNDKRLLYEEKGLARINDFGLMFQQMVI